jgi:hypothetical protein
MHIIKYNLSNYSKIFLSLFRWNALTWQVLNYFENQGVTLRLCRRWASHPTESPRPPQSRAPSFPRPSTAGTAAPLLHRAEPACIPAAGESQATAVIHRGLVSPRPRFSVRLPSTLTMPPVLLPPHHAAGPSHSSTRTIPLAPGHSSNRAAPAPPHHHVAQRRHPLCALRELPLRWWVFSSHQGPHARLLLPRGAHPSSRRPTHHQPPHHSQSSRFAGPG